MRNALLICLALAVFGCEEQKMTTEQPAPTPTPAPAEKEVMAYVGETPIYMEELHEILIRSQGLGYSRMLIANELVRQAAAAENITVTDADVEAETDLMLEQMTGSKPSPEEREKYISFIKQQYNVTDDQWNLTMLRTATLRKLAEKRVKITDEMVNEAFAQKYGRKYMVRHIQVPTLDKAQEILELLKEGGDFSKLAEEHSIAPTRYDGGVLPPLTDKAPESPEFAAIQKVAVTMKEVGQISDPIKAGDSFHIIKLDKIVEPENVKLEDVKDELVKELTAMEISRTQPMIMADLLRSAQSDGTIRYVNPTLKAMNDQQNATPEPQE